jgi:hypothetical protein
MGFFRAALDLAAFSPAVACLSLLGGALTVSLMEAGSSAVGEERWITAREDGAAAARRVFLVLRGGVRTFDPPECLVLGAIMSIWCGMQLQGMVLLEGQVVGWAA